MSIAKKLQGRGGGSAFQAAAQTETRQEEAEARSEVMDEKTGRVRRASKAPLDAVVYNPLNPRKTYSEEALRETADSLIARGQITPITVVSRDAFLAAHPDQAPALGDAEFVALDGNRRLRAAHLAGLETVRVDLNDDLAEDAASMLEAALIANIHREDVPPLEEAQAIHDLMTRVYGGVQADVARALAKSPQWVGQRLALLHLAPELQEQVERKELGVKEARRIGAATRAGKLAPEDQQKAAAEARAAKARTAAPAPARGVNPVYPSTTEPPTPSPDPAQPAGVNLVYSGAPGASGALVPAGGVNPVYSDAPNPGTTATPEDGVNPVYSEAGAPLPEQREQPPADRLPAPPVILHLNPADVVTSAQAVRDALGLRPAVHLAAVLIELLQREPEFPEIIAMIRSRVAQQG